MSNLDDTIRSEEQTNGKFEHVADLAQALKFAMRRGQNWDKLHMASKEALENAATYIATILSGDHTDGDHWNDLAATIRMRGKMLEPMKMLDAAEHSLAAIDRALRVVEDSA